MGGIPISVHHSIRWRIVVDHDRRNGPLALQISLGDAMGTIKQFGPTWS